MNRSRFIPFLLALFCLVMIIFEGIFRTIIAQLSFIHDDWHVISHLFIIFNIYIIIYFERNHTYYGLFFAMFFGLMTDILYTDILGVYLFVYTATAYLVRLLMKWLHDHFIVALLIAIIMIIVTDILAYLLYDIIQIHQMSWSVYWRQRLIPSFIWNFIASIILYLIFARRLQHWANITFDRKD